VSALRALFDRLCPPAPTPPPRRETISFLPGSITLLGEHDPQLSRADVARGMRASLQQLQLSQQIVIPEQVSERSVVTFLAGGRAISTVTGIVPSTGSAPGRTIVSLVRELNRQLKPQAPTRRPPTGPAASLVAAQPAQPQVRLLVASPQWLSTGSPTAKGGGGPGGRPVLARAVTRRGADAPPWRVSVLPDAPTQQASASARGEGVIVAVLDTLQDAETLDRAYAQFVVNPAPGTAPHPALAGLWGERRRLQLVPAGASHLLQEVTCELADHDYVMPDHGLFAAGIIHSIAPEAEIQLIEVLNPFGVGSLASIAHGLATVLELRAKYPTRPIVVNLSLVMTIPQLDAAMIAYLSQSDPALSAFTPEEIEQTSYLLQQLCYLLLDENIIVVAAAGNDADDQGIARALDGRRPDARFPAAFVDILGVGALNHDETPAVYSNRSDRPQSQGLAVWGGDKSATSELTDPANGLLGLYVSSSFPDGTANDSGWARWCGTSFATPIISGALAALLSQNPPPADPIQTLRDLSTRVAAEIGEIVPVTQVP
jgi:hypothetical protein